MRDFNFEELVLFRKELHRHPELSGKEHETASRIKAFLQRFEPDEVIDRIGGSGVAAIFEGKQAGPTILIRCELDALPIQEVNTFEHRSKRAGVSHKCGHDGHMAIICGLAEILHAYKIEKGRVVLLFQPAEENGKGAAAVLADKKFEQIKPDYVFALHNIPGFAESQIIIKSGSFTPSVNSIIIQLKGKTAHASEPHNGINPALAMTEITQQLLSLNQHDISQEDFCVATPVYLSLGDKAYGVSAGYGEVHFTLRCGNNAFMQKTEQKAASLAKEVAQKHRLGCDINWEESFYANENDAQAVALICESAKACGLPIFEADVPFPWGEDFGLFTASFKGAMFGLGAGEDVPALHNPDYDFPDHIIPAGINTFYTIIQKILHV